MSCHALFRASRFAFVQATVLTENNERLLEAKLGGGRGDREKGTRDKGLHRAGLTFWFDLFS